VSDEPVTSSRGEPPPSKGEVARRLERQLEIAQQITHIGSWEWDLATNSVTWSDELYRIYGLEPRSREITLDFFLSRVHEEDRARTMANVREALERGGRFGYPERIRRPDGSIRILDTVGEVARDRSGRIVGLIGTCRDVTEQHALDETVRIFGDIVRNVQIGLAVFQLQDTNDPSGARLVTFNPAAEEIARMPLGPWIGKPYRDIAPYARGGELERLIAAVARGGGVHEAAVFASRDPRDPTRALSMKAFPLPGGRIGIAIEDITEKTRVQRLREAEQRILEMIASGAPLVEVLMTLCRAIEEHSPSTLASILLLDEDGAHVRHGAAPTLPEGFTRAVDGAPVGPKGGSCGTAVSRRAPVFVEDIETDPLWDDYRTLARSFGLRACWSMPVLAVDGRVLGTFALYYREPRRPTDDDVKLITRASRLAGIAIERRQLEDQLRALSAHVEEIREDERTGIAREIHDELGQALTALKIDLSWIGRRLADAPIPADAIGDKLRTLAKMTDEIIDSVRRISAELRPGALDDLGLVAAVEWEVQQFERRTGVTCMVKADVDDTGLARDVSTAVFRILQEALTNVARHANATRVEVRLTLGIDRLRLEVQDDGKGITPEAAFAAKALGLLGIRERALRLGGSASVTGASDVGTTVTVELPTRGSDPRATHDTGGAAK
jgi:PAS domain S-box-containing protein